MMKRSFALLPVMAIAVLTTAEVIASSVGGGIFVPVTAVRSSAQCPTGHCRNGSTCGHCAKLGFACVDRETTAPCTADGGCYPKRPTFGHYEQKWRTWPGEVDSSAPSPTLSEEESLLKSYDAPPAEDEDQQAPPPIEDSIDESGDEIPSAIPAVEIDLPPLPRSAPERPSLQQQPAPNFRQPGNPGVGPPNVRQLNQRPPAPPFGLFEPSQTEENLTNESMADEFSATEIKTFARPVGYLPQAQGTQAHGPSQKGPLLNYKQGRNLVVNVGGGSTVKKNSPPALPAGFTQADRNQAANPMIRRLPVAPQHRFDKAVKTVAAYE